MSDPMAGGMPPPGMPPGGMPPPGMPPGGMPPRGAGASPEAVSAKMGQMQSLFNPADIAAMLQRGEITPQTKFGELLAKMGISPDDTIMDVVQKVMRETGKANPLEKMKALSQAGPQGPPPGPPGMPPGMPPGGGGMPPAPGPSAPGSMDELFGA